MQPPTSARSALPDLKIKISRARVATNSIKTIQAGEPEGMGKPRSNAGELIPDDCRIRRRRKGATTSCAKKRSAHSPTPTLPEVASMRVAAGEQWQPAFSQPSVLPKHCRKSTIVMFATNLDGNGTIPNEAKNPTSTTVNNASVSTVLSEAHIDIPACSLLLRPRLNQDSLPQLSRWPSAQSLRSDFVRASAESPCQVREGLLDTEASSRGACSRCLRSGSFAEASRRGCASCRETRSPS
mmetsp:Transcript_50468/g.118485  ORF Transcript_50468/g.118485 Transcript_50468/m.118485 type:complete len:240 (-) Transcript_50468:703-1422(-)